MHTGVRSPANETDSTDATTRRPPVVGYIAPNVHGYFFGSILTAVIDTASAHGAQIVAVQTHDAGLLTFASEQFTAQVSWDHLDALVVPQAAVNASYLQAFAATGKPVVALYEAPAGLACPTVVPDNDQGVRASVDHLVAHGHTRIAFVGRDPANGDDAIRHEAYRRAMLAHGLVPTAAVPVPWRLDETYDGPLTVRRMRELGELPTAVVACTDATAMALIEALAAEGLVVPDDVAVVGFDDIPEAAEHHPALTTVAQSFTLAGSTACELALQALDGGPVEPGLHHTPVTFVVRESCGCRPTSSRVDGEESVLEDSGVPAAHERVPAPDGVGDAAALRRIAAEATRAMRRHRRQQSDAVVNQHVQRQRRFNFVSTELVRRQGRDVRSLAWLKGTDVPSGTLALWDDDHELRLVGSYADEGGGGRRDEPCGVRAFPPASTHGGARPHDLTLVVPIRFDGSDHGFLALTGPFDVMDEAVFERFNHWAVLLTVALDQERAVERLRVSEERYALAAEAANDGMWDWDLGTGAVYYSPRWKELLGFGEDDVTATAQEWLDRVHPADRPAVDGALARLRDGGGPALEVEYRIRTAAGTYRWMVTTSVSVPGSDGTATRLVGSMTDVDERRRLEEQLRRDAHYDPLTGLPNRALFLDRLTQSILRTRRHPDHRFAVVFMDLDGFKVVNDSLGHQVGDALLVQVAKRLSSEVRVTDTVSRFGGDEFAVLLEEVDDVARLPDMVRRLLSLMAVPVTLNEGTRTVSAAAGIAVSASGYDSADEYLRDADTAMYRAKAQGPGSVVLFDTAMHAGAMARLQMESALDQGIALQQFELYYQPIVRLDTRRIVGVEALIRWHHPERGLVAPNDFLPIAEATGHTRPIGRWTILEACRQLREWLDDVPGLDGFTVSVNLSNRQFWDPDLLTSLRTALDRYAVPASSIVFEVTEGVIMQDQEVAVSFLRQLRDEGVTLHVDDFGTGHSSLSTLHELPVGALKIDRSFVQRMQSSPRSRELVGLMVTMGARFDLNVIAEGIETEEEAATLAELGCPLVQGYLFSRPVPAAQATQLLLGQAAAGSVPHGRAPTTTPGAAATTSR